MKPERARNWTASARDGVTYASAIQDLSGPLAVEAEKRLATTTDTANSVASAADVSDESAPGTT